MNRFNVAIGEGFEVQAFELESIEYVDQLSRIQERRSRERVRATLSYCLLGSIGIALLLATAIGFYDGSFNEVDLVWGAAALPLGLVLRSYFETSTNLERSDMYVATGKFFPAGAKAGPDGSSPEISG